MPFRHAVQWLSCILCVCLLVCRDKNLNIIWTGYGRRIPVMLFNVSSVMRKSDIFKTVGGEFQSCTRRDVHTFLHMRTHTYALTQTHTCILTHTHTHKHKHTYIHTHAHIHTHTHTHTQTQTHTHTHTHTHLHAHSFRYTPIYFLFCFCWIVLGVLFVYLFERVGQMGSFEIDDFVKLLWRHTHFGDVACLSV